MVMLFIRNVVFIRTWNFFTKPKSACWSRGVCLNSQSFVSCAWNCLSTM